MAADLYFDTILSENFRFSEKVDIVELEFSLRGDIHLSWIISKYILDMSYFSPLDAPI